MSVKLRFLSCVVVAGLLSVAGAQEGSTMKSDASAKSESSGKMSMADQKFVKEAAQGGMAEVELGKLATEKASSEEVKKFGQRMVDDHSKANDQLKELASSKGIKLPDSPSPSQKAAKERLSKMSGEQFDKAYMTDMLKDHKKDVSSFQTESNSGKDPEVKNFASQTLPTLRDHLKEAQSIAPKAIQAKGAMAQKTSQQ